ncbi:hypothetical protein FRB91_011048 [Serendipita sp. 411]|nr:hypothetical protein FRC18_001535 [Serendipita sp. 400]KAG8848186.1 hypothetical protein FRB91_011048 [Serendipita sp. 411]
MRRMGPKVLGSQTGQEEIKVNYQGESFEDKIPSLTLPQKLGVIVRINGFLAVDATAARRLAKFEYISFSIEAGNSSALLLAQPPPAPPSQVSPRLLVNFEAGNFYLEKLALPADPPPLLVH